MRGAHKYFSYSGMQSSQYDAGSVRVIFEKSRRFACRFGACGKNRAVSLIRFFLDNRKSRR